MDILISRAVADDAQAMLEYLNTVGGETDNLTFGKEGLTISVEDEKIFLQSLENSTSSMMLVAKHKGKIVGIAGLSGYPKERMKHRGELAVSVLKAFWGNGIASRLMEEILAFAKDVANIEIISLEVRSDNVRAIGLYKKYGFEKIGEFKGFFKIDDAFVDFDLMNLYIK